MGPLEWGQCANSSPGSVNELPIASQIQRETSTQGMLFQTLRRLQKVFRSGILQPYMGAKDM